ncbi:MAG: hypothetical protein A2846_02720 [Candidatus Doudnabacteria bacterium RIFCSPHIGHO2_01_FULL_49_9]|uniref:Segregation and condensation protein A n=1 Tax=Candidatus Doudnabacteria bacterium RIFCSPHIGHO2_01_FULL_49_9 TaxID=1817827 RepID=A0A1F5P3D3_9BACT|nr:MAG: hypothetical protein A2846_02720 [Candidatus Doudnabacteria bacterium RIFCSPHIGHO2_01_FULL_49_9]
MKIKTEKFEGPLDLLLKLIEEQKLDITEITLATVTEQFLAYIRSENALKPKDLADWLVVAAKLLVIKSRVLIPHLELSEEEQQDATDLAWQLYQYKCYKEAAKYLKTMESRRLQSWGREAVFTEKISFYPDPGAGTAALSSAMKFLAKTLEEIVTLPKKILEEVVTISEKIEHLQKTLAERVELKLKDLVANAKSKTEVIVTFLALLELVKQRIFVVEQETLFSDITIKKTK